MSQSTIYILIPLALLFLLWALVLESRAGLARNEREQLAAKANQFRDSRKSERPYAVYKSGLGWEWRVLQTYKLAADDAKDRHARWLVAVKSPNTNGKFETTDAYAIDILTYGRLVACTDDWLKEYGKRSSIAHDIQTLD